MPGTAAKVFFSEVQMQMLEEIVASRTAAVRLVQRAQIVLLAYQKRNNEQIGEVVGLNPQQVSVWRKRWKAKQDHLIHVECADTKAALRRAAPSKPFWPTDLARDATPTLPPTSRPPLSPSPARIPTLSRNVPFRSGRIRRSPTRRSGVKLSRPSRPVVSGLF